jgi:hypothetical protein
LLDPGRGGDADSLSYLRCIMGMVLTRVGARWSRESGESKPDSERVGGEYLGYPRVENGAWSGGGRGDDQWRATILRSLFPPFPLCDAYDGDQILQSYTIITVSRMIGDRCPSP